MCVDFFFVKKNEIPINFNQYIIKLNFLKLILNRFSLVKLLP